MNIKFHIDLLIFQSQIRDMTPIAIMLDPITKIELEQELGHLEYPIIKYRGINIFSVVYENNDKIIDVSNVYT